MSVQIYIQNGEAVIDKGGYRLYMGIGELPELAGQLAMLLEQS